jgi:uncharacterized protein YndB with AHSA1/START domain
MMTKSRTANTTFTLERVYDATPARVFAAWADPAAKAVWFIGPGEGRNTRAATTSSSAAPSA